MFYQILSRNNSPSGHAIRLVTLYNDDCQCINAILCDSSSPDAVYHLDLHNAKRIGSLHLSPAEFKLTKDKYRPVLIPESAWLDKVKEDKTFS